MATKAWISRHTGLPSAASTEDVDVRVSDGRVLRRAGGGGDFAISDAFAPPGVELEYQVGDERFRLMRPLGRPGLGILSTLNGRALPAVYQVDNKDPIQQESAVMRFPSGALRWPMLKERATGESDFLILSPDLEEGLRSVLNAAEPLIMGPSTPTPGVPMRVISVSSWRRERDRSGRIRYEVKWSEEDPGKFVFAAPVVTWGDLEGFGMRWKSGTVEQLANELGGGGV